MTWVKEEGALLLRSGGNILDDRKACRSGGAIMIVHRNLEGSAL